ncbi:MAG: hypothetical protein K0S47_4514 [Herbinix sp.]|jgi:hypothetical protein|nr:hypothetical protein [Herbinix sp.]MDF2845491.1 hypothetical protein [Herbinix sp.]
MEELNVSVQRIIENFDSVCNDLYQQEQKRAYDKLNIVLGDLTQVLNEISLMEGFDMNKLMNNLAEALKAMEAMDYVLLADIIKYEIIEQLTTLS